MQYLFNNPLSNFLTKLIYIFWLNCLWFTTSIPLFTLGASTTALYTVTLQLVRDEHTNVTSTFLKAFKSNFKQSTILLLILFLVGGVCGVDFWYFSEKSHPFFKLLSMFFLGMILIYLVVLIYVFPLLAQFNNTIRNTLHNAFIISISHLPLSLMILILTVAISLFTVYAALPLILLGFPLLAFIQSYLLNNIFKKYFPRESIV